LRKEQSAWSRKDSLHAADANLILSSRNRRCEHEFHQKAFRNSSCPH
jgi:hypothetical protein